MTNKNEVFTPEIENIYKAIIKLENIQDCRAFFEDLCTIKEIHAMAQRFDVARKLKDGMTFNDIVESTGASTATISRVNKCLLYGSGGYDIVLNDK